MFETKNKKLRIVLECICMPIFLACISFTLIYTVVSVKVVNPKLALDTVKTVLGGDGVFEFPDRKDIYHGDDNTQPTSPSGNDGDPDDPSHTGEDPTDDEEPTNGDDPSSPTSPTSPDDPLDPTLPTDPIQPDGDYINMKDIEFPMFNTVFGEIELPKLGRTLNLIMGETEQAITEGAAVHTSSYLPGYGGTTLISTHNNNVVRLDKIGEGDEIFVRTHYGEYTYRVTSVKIVDKNDPNAFKVSDRGYNLVFVTCYPLRKPSNATQRMVVYAEMVSGPKVVR